MDLPTWLREDSPASPETGIPSGRPFKIKRRSKHSFIQKTLQDIIQFLQDSVFSEGVAAQPGFLQSLDPRVKVAALFTLLLSLNLIRHLALLWGFYLVLLVAASFSGLSVRFILKKVWLVVPLFTGIMAIPALFNWVRPGDALWVLWDFGHPLNLGLVHLPSTLAMTRQGLKGDILLISRVGISVSLAMVLTLTTRWHDLLRALRSFFLPKVFVTALEMTYRYLFVLVTAVEEMFLARKARDAGFSTTKEQRRFIASSMAGLFGKSHQMSEEIYFSMLARGYTGEIRSVERFHLRLFDLFASGIVLFSALTLYAADKVLGE